jgi:hypothetical protein
MLPLDVLCVTVVVVAAAVHPVAAVLAPRPVVRLASCLPVETATMIAVVAIAATVTALAARMSATVTLRTSATVRTLATVMTTAKGSVNPSVTLNVRPSTSNATSAMPSLTALLRRSTRVSFDLLARLTPANDLAEHEAPPAPQHDDLDTAE